MIMAYHLFGNLLSIRPLRTYLYFCEIIIEINEWINK